MKQSQQKVYIALAAATVLIIVMAVMSVALQGAASPLANGLGTLLSPVRNGAAAVGDFFESIFAYVYDFEDLQRENEELLARLAAMEQNIREGEAALAENDRLRELLGLAEKHRDFEYVMADVVSRGTSNWESVFTISAGTRDGIEPYDCVIDKAGNLVGQITEVGDRYAVVSTLVDTSSELGAQLYRTGVAAVLEGDFALMNDCKLKLTYLPPDAGILNGDLVLTSGIGGVYPPGLVVGTVSEVSPLSTGTGDYAIVIPTADVESIANVFVITAFDIAQ